MTSWATASSKPMLGFCVDLDQGNHGPAVQVLTHRQARIGSRNFSQNLRGPNARSKPSDFGGTPRQASQKAFALLGAVALFIVAILLGLAVSAALFIQYMQWQ